MNAQQLPLVTFEQAKRLKELGFNWYVDNCYDFVYTNTMTDNGSWILESGRFDNFHTPVKGIDLRSRYLTSAPTVALALKWMRDEKGISGLVEHAFVPDKENRSYIGVYTYEDSMIQIQSKTELREDGSPKFGHYDTVEEAESELLDELLTILEKENEL